MTVRAKLERFIKKANKKFNNKFDYNLSVYVSDKTKIKIICPTHGAFEQTPQNHLKSMFGCAKCNTVSRKNKRKTYTTEMFIEKANKVHNSSYSYSKTVYKGSGSKVVITCPTCGDFKQYASDHLQGRGCPKCSANARKSTRWFIEKSQKIHNNKFDYSKVIYLGVRSKVEIICPTHGSFIQEAKGHLRGRGCNLCRIEKGRRDWGIDAQLSPSFESFKLYFIKAWSEDESFYKIGVTYRKIEERFRKGNNKLLPYDYKIVATKEGKRSDVIKWEQDFIEEFSHSKYIPYKEFHGVEECFEELNVEDIKAEWFTNHI